MNIDPAHDPSSMTGVSRRRGWRPRFWHVALVLIAVSEAFVLVQFIEARDARQASPCGRECIAEDTQVVYWGAVMLIWPIVAAIAATLIKILVLFVVWVWHQVDRNQALP